MNQPAAAKPSAPRRRRGHLWWGLLGVVLLVGLSVVWLKMSTGLRGRERRAWKDRAIAEISNRTADAKGLAAELEAVKAGFAAHPDSSAWVGEHLVLMQNSEWIAYASICSKEDPRILDIFIGRGSDGRWYYSTFHFCRQMVTLRMMEEQPESLSKFVNWYYLNKFDGSSNECLSKTWPLKRQDDPKASERGPW